MQTQAGGGVWGGEWGVDDCKMTDKSVSEMAATVAQAITVALIGCAVQSISSMIIISERVQPLGDNQIYGAFWQIELTFVCYTGIFHHCTNNAELP